MKIDFEMRLHNNSFERIKSGGKIIEVRLFDKKRKLLKVGNIIRFRKRFVPDNFVDVRIVELLKYDSFKDLFLNYGAKFHGLSLNYSCKDFVKSFREFYSIKKEKRFGVLGIKFELVENENCGFAKDDNG